MSQSETTAIAHDVAAFFAALDEYTEPIPPDVLQQRMRALTITPDDIRQYIRFNDDWYARNRIHIGRCYHALALCWLPGQQSAIHDHAGSACGVKVVQGNVTETKYDRSPDGVLTPTATGSLECGEVCASYDSDIHILTNPSEDVPLVTLHIYSPPLLNASTYSLDSTEPTPWVDALLDEVPPTRFDD